MSMESWANLWAIVLLVVLVVFSIVSIVVAIGGFSDVKAMFTSMESGESDQELSQSEGEER